MRVALVPNDQSSQNISLGIWVPAFAGTTPRM
ncbi:hypothetical protein ACVWXO_008850 [Bradyrhizobium sp. LM2.7]